MKNKRNSLIFRVDFETNEESYDGHGDVEDVIETCISNEIEISCVHDNVIESGFSITKLFSDKDGFSEIIEESQEEMEIYGQKYLKNCPNCNIELEVSKCNDVHFGNSCTDVVRIHCEKCYYEEAMFSC